MRGLSGLSVFFIIFYSLLGNACPAPESLLDKMSGRWRGEGTKEVAGSSQNIRVDVHTNADFVNSIVLQSHSRFIETNLDEGTTEYFESSYYIRPVDQCDGAYRWYEMSQDLEFTETNLAKFDGQELFALEEVTPYKLVTLSKFVEPGKVNSTISFTVDGRLLSRTRLQYIRLQ